MKRVICAALALALLLAGCAGPAPQEGGQGDTFGIVTSFYPVYIAALNIANGVEGVTVTNLVNSQVGCLHDYTLTTEEMRKIEACDVLVINGAGMEPFMDKISANMPELPVISASDGISLIEEDGETNPHVWMDVKNAIEQVDAIAKRLGELCPEHADTFAKNARAYQEKLTALDAEIRQSLAPVAGAKLVTFHQAFTYFANAYHLEIAAVIRRDEHSAPSPAEVEAVIETMKAEKIHAIFIEPQYQDSVAETVSAATGAMVYTLDPAVTGDASEDAYLDIMRENVRTLLEALQ